MPDLAPAARFHLDAPVVPGTSPGAGRILAARRNFARWLDILETEPSPDRRWALREAGWALRYDVGFIRSLPHPRPPLLPPFLIAATLAFGGFAAWLGLVGLLLLPPILMLGCAAFFSVMPTAERSALGDGHKAWVQVVHRAARQSSSDGALSRIAEATRSTSTGQDEAALERAARRLPFARLVAALEAIHHAARAAEAGAPRVAFDGRTEELLGELHEALGFAGVVLEVRRNQTYTVSAPDL